MGVVEHFLHSALWAVVYHTCIIYSWVFAKFFLVSHKRLLSPRIVSETSFCAVQLKPLLFSAQRIHFYNLEDVHLGRILKPWIYKYNVLTMRNTSHFVQVSFNFLLLNMKYNLQF